MGESATPAMIREEAYRVGFGKVSPAMLVAVRNEIFPDREKHSTAEPRNVDDADVLSLIACPACGSTRTRARNVRRVGAVFHRRHVCRGCGLEYRTKSETQLRGKSEHANGAARSLTEKRCTRCKEIKAIDAFSKRGSGSDLYRPACRDCLNKSRADQQFVETLATHGLTAERYATILAEQGGLCAICRQPGKGKGERHYPLCFDHCHKAGRFRGLLCDKCNLGIGNFDDDIDRLTAAVEYLRRNQTGNS